MWRLLRCEPPLEIEPGTAMCFRPPDLLEYMIPAADTTLSLMLRWRITGNELRTEHPDGSNPMRVDVALTGEGVLTFDFGGPRAWFVRAI